MHDALYLLPPHMVSIRLLLDGCGSDVNPAGTAKKGTSDKPSSTKDPPPLLQTSTPTSAGRVCVPFHAVLERFLAHCYAAGGHKQHINACRDKENVGDGGGVYGFDLVEREREESKNIPRHAKKEFEWHSPSLVMTLIILLTQSTVLYRFLKNGI
jgi:hypothetical protein